MIDVVQILRYPIKGLSAQALESICLVRGQSIPHDRRFALLHEEGHFDFNAPTWQPRHNFYVLKNYAQLAALKLDYDSQTTMVTIRHQGRQVISGRLDDAADRLRIETFLAHYFNTSKRPRIVDVPGVHFTDQKEQYLSIINLNSVRTLQAVLHQPIDAIRFRGNLLIDGAEAWEEFSWIHSTLSIGTAQLEVVDVIERCAATNVDPTTAQRDLNIPRTLQKEYDHCNFGIFAKVTVPGTIKINETLLVEDQVDNVGT